MSQGTPTPLPLQPWTAGLPIGPSVWLDPSRVVSRPDILFRTETGLGQVTSGEGITTWQCSLDLSEAFSAAEADCFHNGFRLMGEGDARIYGTAVDTGVLLLQVPGDCQPRLGLVGEAPANVPEDQVQELDVEGLHIRLEPVGASDGEHRYALQVTRTQGVFLPASTWAETDPRTPLLNVREKLISYVERAGGTLLGQQTRVSLETLAAQLRPGTEHLPGPWMAGENERWVAADLHLAVSTWVCVDPEQAASLLQTAFAWSAQHDHQLPDWIDPYTGAHGDGVAWPILAQCLHLVEQTLPGQGRAGTWISEAATFLHNLLHATDAPLPSWPASSTPVVGAPSDGSGHAVDLLALSAAECEALELLASHTGDRTVADGWSAQKEQLTGALLDRAWNPATRLFHDCDDGEGILPTPTAAGFLPWLSASVRKRVNTDLLQPAAPPWLTDEGLQLNPEGEKSDQTPVQSARLMALLLDAYHRENTRATLEELVDHVTAAAADATDYAPWQVHANRLAASYVTPSADAVYRHYPKALLWLDRFRGSIGALIILAFFGCLMLISTIVIRHNTYTGRVQHSFDSMARQKYALGKHDEAIPMLETMIPRTADPKLKDQYRLLIGNMHFKDEKFADALVHYDALSDREGVDYRSSYNRCVALFQLQRYDEAKAAFEAYIDKYGEDYPNLRTRAVAAIELVEDQAGQAKARAEKAKR